MCGVVVAIQMFAAAGAKRGSGRIIVISDGSLPPDEGRETLDSGIVDQLSAHGLAVDVFAVGGWGAPDDDADDTLGKPSTSSLGLRPQLLQLARASGGTVSPVKSAVALLCSFRARTVAQRSKYRVDIDLGNGMVRMPVFAYGLTAEAKVPTLKKTTQRALQGASAQDPEAMDDGETGARAATGPAVQMERGYARIPAAAADDAGDEDAAEAGNVEAAPAEVLSSEDITKAYKYGSSYVIPLAGDSDEWKYQTGERSFKVLGENSVGRAA